MESLLGHGNTLFDYLLVLLFYGAMFVLIHYGSRRVELNFRKTFLILYIGWGFGVFIGNYLFYLIGIMSFLPWLNNAFHTLIWIGLCLGFLYAGCYRRSIPEQVALFVIFSFLVKVAERTILGTWELDHFFGIDGNWSYIIGWSLMDGLYPFISAIGLRLVSRFTSGVIVPRL